MSGVGNLRVWKFIQHSNTYVLDSPRLCIEDLNMEEWITLSIYVKCGQIFAAYDNNVNVYIFT